MDKDVIEVLGSVVQGEGSKKLLHKICQNIVKFPSESKYRRISKTNKAIQEKIVNQSGASEFLTCLGFVEEDDSFVFKGDVANLSTAIEVLGFEASPTQMTTSSTSIAQNDQNEDEYERERKKIIERREQEAKLRREEDKKLRELAKLRIREQQDRLRDEQTYMSRNNSNSHSSSSSNVKSFKDIGVDLNAKGG